MMPIKDVFLPLVGEPSAAAIAAIEKCVAISGDFGARICALAVEQDILVRPKGMMSSELDNAAATRGLRGDTGGQGLLLACHTASVRVGGPNGQKVKPSPQGDDE